MLQTAAPEPRRHSWAMVQKYSCDIGILINVAVYIPQRNFDNGLQLQCRSLVPFKSILLWDLQKIGPRLSDRFNTSTELSRKYSYVVLQMPRKILFYLSLGEIEGPQDKVAALQHVYTNVPILKAFNTNELL